MVMWLPESAECPSGGDNLAVINALQSFNFQPRRSLPSVGPTVFPIGDVCPLYGGQPFVCIEDVTSVALVAHGTAPCGGNVLDAQQARTIPGTDAQTRDVHEGVSGISMSPRRLVK